MSKKSLLKLNRYNLEIQDGCENPSAIWLKAKNIFVYFVIKAYEKSFEVKFIEWGKG